MTPLVDQTPAINLLLKAKSVAEATEDRLNAELDDLQREMNKLRERADKAVQELKDARAEISAHASVLSQLHTMGYRW